MNTMIIVTSMLIITMKHPLSMGLTLLITAMMTSACSISMSNSPWYPFIFFIIMVGGVLILFLYMASISPNSLKMSSLLLPMTLMLALSTLMMNEMKNNQTTINMLSMKTMFFSSNSLMIPLMASYLLIAMILIIKITNKNKNPLRKS